MKVLYLVTIFFVATFNKMAQGQSNPQVELIEQHTFTGEVNDIAMTQNHLWLATTGGLVIHHRSDGSYLGKLTSIDGLMGNKLRIVKSIDDDRLFVGGDFGAVIISDLTKLPQLNRLTVKPIITINPSLSYNPIQALIKHRGELWLLQHQSGLSKLFDDRQRSFKIGMYQTAVSSPMGILVGSFDGTITVNNPGALPSTIVTLPVPILSLADNHGQIIIATGVSLYLYGNGKLRELSHQDAKIPANKINKYQNKFYITTADGRLYKLHQNKLIKVLKIESEKITAFALDNQKAWLAIERDGLHVGDLMTKQISQSLRPKGEICDNHITQMTTHRGYLVVGTFNRGACFFKNGAWAPLSGLQSPMVYGVASDGANLYIANSNGIARFDANFKLKPIGPKDPATLSWLTQIPATAATEVGPSQVAITNKYGLARIWRNKNGQMTVRFISHENGLPFDATALDAANGEIFIASEKAGLKAMGLSRKAPKHYQDPIDLPENWVTDISAIDEVNIWVATCQSGITHLKNGVSLTINRRNGLPDNRVTAIVANQHGVFAGTLSGLTWISEAQGNIFSFSLLQGIPDPRSASLFWYKKNLWLGTEAGLAKFRVNG